MAEGLSWSGLAEVSEVAAGPPMPARRLVQHADADPGSAPGPASPGTLVPSRNFASSLANYDRAMCGRQARYGTCDLRNGELVTIAEDEARSTARAKSGW